MFKLFGLIVYSSWLLASGQSLLKVGDISTNAIFEAPSCMGRNAQNVISNPQCYSKTCARLVVDGSFTDEEARRLLGIANKGMATRESVGGPTILDINTGYIRDSNGLDNLFAKENKIFDEDDFEVYSSVINRLKQLVENSFKISNVFFTAPTFITRLDGRSDWTPQEIHDEYWHVHTDMNNTEHYQYSGLLYLSTYQQDFTGGRVVFVDSNDEETPVYTVEPQLGRVVIFSSGQENPHYVEQVTSGQRFVLAFWFTCDERKQFEIFLDGEAHLEFSNKLGKQILNKRKQQQQHIQKKEKEEL